MTNDFEADEIPTKTDLSPPRVPRSDSEHWRLSHDARMRRLEANMDLCLNYIRAMAADRLGADAVARIESSVGNGHG